ncbi:hypothetical protein IWW40_002675 [Coemansia sp. RSA 1250]|nr:hypothetical protein IWW40_002675 [Coemansia sp. RSA 1250]
MGLSEQKSRIMYAADPRNLNWSQDKSRFGFKMLEKMGWSEGKGLGLNEDGNKEHIKIKLKTNSFGIGADKKTIRNWLANTDGFSQLLDRLNAESPSTSDNQEAPKAPERMGSRMSHRAKFRRMKQMAVRDERGLQEILGVRVDKSDEPEPVQSIRPPKDNTVVANLSATDYFAQKMADNPALAAIYGTPATKRSASSDEEETKKPDRKKRKKESSKDKKSKKHDKKSKKSKSKKEKKSKDKKKSKT